jgi:ubiquinone/menaquinone biosynthesis C-methylase UbiE
MKFSKETFDIIWAEGVGGFIGFETSLREWKRFLKPKGYLVLHNEAKRLYSGLKTVSKHSYSIISQFMLPENAWWEEYYQPFEQQINQLTKQYQNNPTALKSLKPYQEELRSFKKNPQSSGFVIIQKQ